MTLVPRTSWNNLRQLQNEMEHLFNHPLTSDESTNVVGGDWVPAVDIKEEADRYVVHADIPGVTPEQIEVSADNGMLTIKGERNAEKKEEKDDYKRIERSYGSFYRRFSLPDDTDPEQISASGKNGVLEIVIPKVEAKKPRKITVQG